MTSPATELSRQLSQNAETVCRHYLSNGRKQGHYWLVGDVHNTPGRSMFVRLSGPLSGNRAAGKWTEHVAARVMLRWRELARFGGGSRGAGQHNLSAPGGFS